MDSGSDDSRSASSRSTSSSPSIESSYYHAGPSTPAVEVPRTPATSSGSGLKLKLVLPSLKSVQALRNQDSSLTDTGASGSRSTGGRPAKKRKVSLVVKGDQQVQKTPRPVKLKPLKEVLTKLIAQIKRKDDYAFFLHPVDPEQVSGYTDVIKNPMDLGTMTTKVYRGRYRSLEEFADDLRLVTTNARIFNPPGTIYHTEATRIENWALEHIAKATASVIEYETDWAVDIDDSQPPPSALPNDDPNAMDVDPSGEGAERGRSLSVVSTPITGGGRRRGAQGGKAGKAQGALSESLEPHGGLPGAKDGLGAFPPGSDWAAMMLALKLRGKRHRTKKERLRMERGGPPYCADGSLDYAEYNPFSVLSFFIREPPLQPSLAILPFSANARASSTAATIAPGPLTPSASTSSQLPPSRLSLSVPPSAEPSTLGPVNIPARPTAVLPASSLPSLTPLPAPKSRSGSNQRTPKRRRHWNILRNAPSRSRAKEGAGEGDDELPTRDARVEDWGVFAYVEGELAEEASRRAAAGAASDDGEDILGMIRDGVERQERTGAESKSQREGREGQVYLRDVVYGGVDGWAYVRSLAQFVTPGAHDLTQDKDPLDTFADTEALDRCKRESEEGLASPEEARGILDEHESTVKREEHEIPHSELKEDLVQESTESPPVGLGVPVAQYVLDTVINPLTDGRHALLAETVRALTSFQPPTTSASLPAPPSKYILDRIARHIQIDMSPLIRTQDELVSVDAALVNLWQGAWARAVHEGGEGVAMRSILDQCAEVISELIRTKENDKLLTNEASSDTSREGDADGDVHMQEESASGNDQTQPAEAAATAPAREPNTEGPSTTRDKQDESEDLALRALRLHLLALAKRAPLERIAPLPAVLVPVGLRGIVPVIDN